MKTDTNFREKYMHFTLLDSQTKDAETNYTQGVYNQVIMPTYAHFLWW